MFLFEVIWATSINVGVTPCPEVTPVTLWVPYRNAGIKPKMFYVLCNHLSPKILFVFGAILDCA